MNQPDFLVEVVAHFLHQRRGPMWVSPRDLLLFMEWDSEAIPLHIVKQAITKVFEGSRTPDGLPSSRIRHADYCDGVVRAEWRDYRRLQIGAPARDRISEAEPAQPEDPQAMSCILKLVQAEILHELEPVLAKDIREKIEALIEQSIGKLTECLAAGEVRQVEDVLDSLRKLDLRIIAEVIGNLEPRELEACREIARRTLQNFGAVNLERVASRTVQEAFERVVRKKFGLSKLESCAMVYL